MNYESLEYPYYRYQEPFSYEKIIRELKKFKPKITFEVPNHIKKENLKKFKGSYLFIHEDYMKNLFINSLTDYFTEKQRIRCRYRTKKAPLSVWNDKKSKIIHFCKKKFKKVNILNLRESINQFTKTCNNFRITICLAVLNYFKPKRWLDISAGWGDRLMSAMLSKHIQYYEASDPNLDLHPGYDKMKNKFTSKKNNYIIHPTGFLEADLGNRMFDFIFSSPPFFNIEIYSNHEHDSIKNFTTNEKWINDFLVPSLIKCYDHLSVDGIFILHIHLEEVVPLIEQHLNNKLEFQGSIYFVETFARQMYVWKKIA